MTSAGKTVAKVRIRFTIVGTTDTTFVGGEKVASVNTNASGVAVAPALQAGETTGDFTVRATVVGRTIAGLDYAASVTPRVADTLVRTSTTALTCVAGGEFADQVEVKATENGAVADKVAATATLVKAADDATENDKGPYFKDADGKTVRTTHGPGHGRRRPPGAAEAVRGRHHRHLPAPRHHHGRRDPHGRTDRDRGRHLLGEPEPQPEPQPERRHEHVRLTERVARRTPAGHERRTRTQDTHAEHRGAPPPRRVGALVVSVPRVCATCSHLAPALLRCPT